MNDLDLTDQEAQELRAWLKERYDEWRYEGPTIDEERPVKAGASPSELTEDDVLEFLVRAVEPWLER